MSRRLNVYDGGVYTSDTANTANAVVERDSSGNSYLNGLYAAGFVSNAGGTLFTGQKALTTNATLDNTATEITADATGGAFTITLPPAATSLGQTYIITKIDSSVNAVTIKGNAAELVNASNTYATGLPGSGQWDTVIVWCNGTKWFAAHMTP